MNSLPVLLPGLVLFYTNDTTLKVQWGSNEGLKCSLLNKLGFHGDGDLGEYSGAHRVVICNHPGCSQWPPYEITIVCVS